jgi:hypothetical protein
MENLLTLAEKVKALHVDNGANEKSPQSVALSF